MSAQERSASRGRGRDTFKSTGRGGMGNMQPASPSPAPKSREPIPESGPDDFSVTRGREPVVNALYKTYTTGRGGAGNFQLSSQAPKGDSSIDETEKEVIREYVNAAENTNFSSGRGGMGNFARSRSRGPAATPAYVPTYSSGRGGAGNIFSGERPPIAAIDEDERKKYTVTKAEGYRSTGRGGSANFIAGQEPPVERVERPSFTASEYESTGRGGAGNMVNESRDRPLSRLQE
ncbi:hypothetical protein BDN70DRAFT_881374 [Pholiota conissans]|uniref:Uncharacterized protein n=1 Tax=Pholiota conissans TaxID=109636 RepID=A0A9P5YY27_9AGAR|nr:hypothetical protein BDN70DRAFT_881374 [Pholiota conissans]